MIVRDNFYSPPVVEDEVKIDVPGFTVHGTAHMHAARIPDEVGTAAHPVEHGPVVGGSVTVEISK